ncbi:Zinc finger CCCH domain-containing protein 15 [Astathelohania contejeani]|uniref:Zinc finger CCCH domain-containing protein 15 n=1 Tax=Astathelohania contejeani TaxID=164912 RepID=A0ABQ7HX84_9MICR|nr:Zinc finger CCCH domain-containing protein 15 [Thelohania contejeani]
MAQKKQAPKKTAKEIEKELLDKSFGQKNKKKSAALKKQIQKVQLQKTQEMKKKPVEQPAPVKPLLVQPKIPVGTDPKTVMCINFLNKNCPDGDKCKYSHKPVEEKKEVVKDSILVCRFLIDAMNSGQYGPSWKCPDIKCRDIHKLTDIDKNSDVEISLEEYLELSRLSIGDNLTLVTEETFKKWKEKKRKEEKAHAEKLKAMREGISGAELFKCKPELFMDDEEALECDYDTRCYSDDESEELVSNMKELSIK